MRPNVKQLALDSGLNPFMLDIITEMLSDNTRRDLVGGLSVQATPDTKPLGRDHYASVHMHMRPVYDLMVFMTRHNLTQIAWPNHGGWYCFRIGEGAAPAHNDR